MKRFQHLKGIREVKIAIFEAAIYNLKVKATRAR
jgi:hypothetical protein